MVIAMQKADLWSCGVALFALLFGQYPFDPQDKFQNRKIVSEDYTIPANIPISPECKHVLQGLLRASPANRMCMEELLCHPWFLKDLPDGALEMNDKYLGQSVSLKQVGGHVFCGNMLCCAQCLQSKRGHQCTQSCLLG